MVPSLKELSYEDRLKRLNLPTLAYRRVRGDMVETYKILCGVYDQEVCDDIFRLRSDSATRGHSKKIFKNYTRLMLRKNSFCNRVVNLWNGLPDDVVSSESTIVFERKLDKLWKDQGLKYNYRTHIRITGGSCGEQATATESNSIWY